jgi:glucans biosynthesis protein C
MSQQLIEPGFFNFWWHYINPNTTLLPEHHSPIGLLTWNHLWFIPYLWCYSMLVLIFSGPLRTLAQNSLLQHVRASWALVVIIIMLLAAWFMLRRHFPSTHALLDDWYNHAKYFLVFVTGYVFALQGSWWQRVITCRNYFMLAALLCYGFLLADRHGAFDTLAAEYQVSVSIQLFYGTILSLNHWSWLFAAVGYAGFWLNKPTNAIDKNGHLLRYCNNAILPWYMLHQTLIIVFAAWLKPLALPIGLEALLLIVLTCLGCWVGYELIRRFWLSRWLFGLKVQLFAVRLTSKSLHNNSTG